MMDPLRVDPELLRAIEDHSPDAPPVFFGHYRLPAKAAKAPLAPNITGLDFSAGLEATSCGLSVGWRSANRRIQLRPEKLSLNVLT